MKACRELADALDEDSCQAVINVYDGNLDEMARFGKIPNSQLEMHIEGKEGGIPHFHVQVKNGKKENCICYVKLLKAEYLRDKDDPMNMLNKDERKALNDYLHKNAYPTDISNWSYLLSRWNEFNPEHAVRLKDHQCPDYTKLKEEG